MRTRTILVLFAAVAWPARFALAQTQATPPPVPAKAVAPGVPRPFPEGFKVAFINPDRIIAESTFGKESSAKVAAMRAQKLVDLNAKNQEIESARQKAAMGSLLTDEARTTVQRTIDRLQVDLQRAQQDADGAVQELQQQLNVELDHRLMPIIEQVARDKGLYLLLRADMGTIAWADPAIDLTSDVVRRLDATSPAAKSPK